MNERGSAVIIVLIVLAAIILFGMATVTGFVHMVAAWTFNHTKSKQ